MAGGSRTPSLYGWEAHRLRVALPPGDWRYIEAGAMHKGFSVSRFLGDILAAWVSDQKAKEARIDLLARRGGMLAPVDANR